MPETFLILLAGGVMLAAAVPRPADVTLHWLRLAGILALCFCGLAAYFYARREPAPAMTPLLLRVQVGLLAVTALAVLAQLASAQVAWRRTQRAFAIASFVAAVLAGSNLLHESMTVRGTAVHLPPKILSMAAQTLACAGAAAMTGLALMDMLLGHAYLTASRMTVAPFRRLNRALIATTLARAAFAVAGPLAAQQYRPAEALWNVHGLYVLTRWGVGLAVPLAFLYMARDCIDRRSTQSATGILYVAGVLVFLGEIVALHLVRETGLPF